MIEIEIEPGTEISEAARRAILVCGNAHQNVRFEFNGVTIYVKYGEQNTIDGIATKLFEGMKTRAAKRQQSEKANAKIETMREFIAWIKSQGSLSIINYSYAIEAYITKLEESK